MEVKSHSMKCPGCGEPHGTTQNTCEYCGRPIIVSTFNSVATMPVPMVGKYANTYKKELEGSPESKELNTAIALCYLKLKLYDKALAAFEKAIEDNFDNSETFFYAAVCLLGGKKAFLTQRATIDKIQEYVNAALMIEPSKGIYHYFLAYIKYDYFERKFFNITPTWQDELDAANTAGTPPSPFDIEQLYGVLGVERPVQL